MPNIMLLELVFYKIIYLSKTLDYFNACSAEPLGYNIVTRGIGACPTAAIFKRRRVIVFIYLFWGDVLGFTAF